MTSFFYAGQRKTDAHNERSAAHADARHHGRHRSSYGLLRASVAASVRCNPTVRACACDNTPKQHRTDLVQVALAHWLLQFPVVVVEQQSQVDVHVVHDQADRVGCVCNASCAVSRVRERCRLFVRSFVSNVTRTGRTERGAPRQQAPRECNGACDDSKQASKVQQSQSNSGPE